MQNRKINSARNILIGLISKIIVFIFAFGCRTIFVRLLGAEYTGINGLYSNILTVLALADLGIGNIFSYTLYQYLARDEKEEIFNLIVTFKRMYVTIGIIVLSLGVLIIPFLPVIVHSSLPKKDVVLYYVLSLLNSVSSYFFVYKTTILIADQKQYISNIWTTVSQCVMYFLQVIFLFKYRSFTGFLIIQVLCTVGRNVILSKISENQYPFIKKSNNKVKIAKGHFAGLWANIKATFIYKICTIALSNTDNILISMILGTVVVGYYSNYAMLIQYIAAYVFILTSGLHASVGNYQVNHDTEDSYNLFNTLSCVYSSIACAVFTVFICCIQQFIPIWVGSEYLLQFECVIAALFVLYIDISLSPVTLYRETLGLFKQAQYIMIPAAILNIVLSVVLGKMIGLSGILFATSISKLLTCCWYEPKIIFNFLQKRVGVYFLKQTKYLIMTCIAVIVSYCATLDLPTSIFGVLLRAIIGLIISALAIISFNWHSFEFRNLMKMIKSMLDRKGRIENV